METRAKVIGSLLIVLCVAGAVAAAITHHFSKTPLPSTDRLKTADWASYGYREAGQGGRRHFNVRMRLSRGQSPLQARLLLNQQDEKNYYFIELTDLETGIGKVESGYESRIGTRGNALPAGRPIEVLVKRRDVDLLVYVDGVLVASAFDDALSGGRVLLGQIGTAGSLESVQVQPVGEVFFTDDFMKAATEQGEWDPASGDWRVETLRNPALSSNAFFYVGEAGTAPAVAVAGHWFWDRYRFRVACKPMGAGAIGILALYRGPGDYYLFRWESESRESGPARQQLIRRLGGDETVLAETEGGYTTGQWYELEIASEADHLFAAIDGTGVLTAHDPLVPCGRIGLYTEASEPSYFDDACAIGEKAFRDGFSERSPGKWLALGGHWQVEKGKEGAGSLQATVVGPGKFVTGARRWSDYRCSAEVVSWDRGTIGLIACYLDELNYHLLSADRDEGKVRLSSVVDGVVSLIDEGVFPEEGRLPRTLSLEVTEGLVRGALDGTLAVVAPLDETLTRGKAGLYGKDCEAAFRSVEVSFPQPSEPILALNEVFAGEKSMAIWSSSESDWNVRTQNKGAGSPLTTYWHRSDFPGDCEIEVDLAGEGSDAGTAPAEASLTVSGDGQSLDSGYLLSLVGDRTRTLSLYRSGKLVAEGATESPARSSLRLKRTGVFILAYTDGHRTLQFRDPRPLTGSRVAVSTPQERFDTASLKVFSPNIYTYNFQRAPDEWREAGGVWKVTNRWQCDPRWSFFSGQSESVAAIWNKRRFEGDLTLEFSAGIKMDAQRGTQYEYASDINATICADGRALSSGYSFLFGGYGNRGTQIVRGKSVVAEAPLTIPQGIHRRWFFIKIRKCGNQLTFFIDNKRILDYTDPEPLEGQRVALWTHNNGIMLTRVRISSESGKQKEPPVPGMPRVAECCYD